jgi:ABC-type cobalt transport system substrate-binding protein
MIPQILLAAWLAFASFLPLRSNAEYEDFADLAIRIDKVLDNSDLQVGALHTQEDIQNWIRETVPFFVYEGITYHAWPVESVTFEYYEEGLARNHIHLLGRANCFTGEITMNKRFINPVSPMYDDASTAISTLIHEVAHIQGICFSGGRIHSEAMTQLAMLEVMAAMANRGNVEALYIFLDELRYMLVTGALIAAREEGKDHQELVQAVYGDNPLMIARLEKAQRYWESDRERYEEIVEWYNYSPMYEVLANLHTGEIRGLMFPINHYCGSGYGFPYYEEVSEFDILKCMQPFKFDDMKYIIEHLEELGAVL